MLHKKSEYRLQYNKLSEDLRRKIWQDNITLRKSRSLSNQATHYWEYQLRSGPCECEVDSGSGPETDSDSGPDPPHRRKHKELQESYRQHLSKTAGTKDARDEAVQTPEWTGNASEHPALEVEPLAGLSSLDVTEEKERRRRPITPTSVASRLRTARSVSRPSRTTRKLATEPKQTHFVPFGWNEKTQKVHESALQASQRRKAEMQECLLEQRGVKHHSRTPRERVHSNSSSVWMSEYQEQFSARSRQPRTASAPPVPRPPVAWRRS